MSDLANVELVTIAKRKAPRKSPTQRSLEHLRGLGYQVAIVEKWNPHSRTRADLFGIFDLLALSPDGDTVGVQVTSGSNASKRVAKINDSPVLPLLRRCEWEIVVHAWAKRADGKYHLRVVDVS